MLQASFFQFTVQYIFFPIVELNKNSCFNTEGDVRVDSGDSQR